MDGQVALWQSGLQDGGDQSEVGMAALLFEKSKTSASDILRIIAGDIKSSGADSYDTLRDGFQKYYMWNEGFSTSTGGLDRILSRFKDLKATVLGLMTQWAKCLLKIPKLLSNYDWSSVVSNFDELGEVAIRADQVTKVTLMDMQSLKTAAEETDNTGNDSDLDSNSESMLNEGGVEEVLEDIKCFMDSLVDLTPSLEHPAMEYMTREDATILLIDDLSGIFELARPFALLIRERFPSMEASLVKRLGEANWKRREQLRYKFSAAIEIRKGLTSAEKANSEEKPLSTNAASSLIPTTRLSSTEASSGFDNTVFDSSAPKRFRVAGSDTSFATSVGDGTDSGRRRVPKLPSTHDFDSSFQCQFCGEELKGVKNMADWRKHVYRDLEPYICLSAECDLGLHTFQSRRDWINHEFQVHRVSTRWDCSICSQDFSSQESFRHHLSDLHNFNTLGIGPSQIEEVIHGSKRLIPRDASSEQCPFCLSVSTPTIKSFAIHVGKHQQEISLAALQTTGVNSDEDTGSDGDDDGDDDGSDNDVAVAVVAPYGNTPVIRNFLEWLLKNQSYSVNDPLIDPQTDECAAFIPISAVTTYLWEDGRLQDILDALFHPAEGPDADIVLPNYVAIFCTLIETGRGPAVEHFVMQGLHDQHLPFDPEHIPSDFPPDTGDGTFYRRFCEKQWRFWVPDFEYMMERHFLNRTLLPIIKKRAVAEGRSARLFEVKVHSSYNKLLPEKDNPNSNIFAVKTYFTSDAAKYYKTEIDAFREWRRFQPHNPHLIAFFGSYIHSGTYNVILEYADNGSLEDYFRVVEPPFALEDISNVWVSLFGILKGLDSIHNVELANPNGGFLSGWHSDIKPKNILVFGNNASSPYEFTFKLAGLGLSHFQKIVKDEAVDSYATSTYGAPECSRQDLFWDTSPLLTKQGVDIWSVGCIYSEVAVWMVRSSRGLQEYRDARKVSTSAFSQRLGDAFHDGENVLEVVSSTHNGLLSTSRASDYITPFVGTIIDRDMLQPSGYRLGIRNIYAKLASMVETPTPILPRSRSSILAISEHGDTQQPGMPAYRQVLPHYNFSPTTFDITHLRGSEVEVQNKRSTSTVAAEKQPLSVNEGAESSLTAAQRKRKQRSTSVLPHLSLSTALQWRADKKETQRFSNILRRKAPPILPGNWLMHNLHRRDHVFIIDDAASMEPHWDEMCHLFGILAYIVKQSDHDGIDMYFTTSETKYNYQDTSKLGDVVTQRKTQLEGQSSIDVRLQHVLGEYNSALKTQIAPRRLNPRTEIREIKPLSVYIFTDGVWTPNSDPKPAIENIVDSLEELYADPGQVSIQFISFGKDPQCLQRLESYDNGLGLKRDIVDHCPSNDNLWKMIFGAIDPELDQSADSDEDEEPNKT